MELIHLINPEKEHKIKPVINEVHCHFVYCGKTEPGKLKQSWAFASRELALAAINIANNALEYDKESIYKDDRSWVVMEDRAYRSFCFTPQHVNDEYWIKEETTKPFLLYSSLDKWVKEQTSQQCPVEDLS